MKKATVIYLGCPKNLVLSENILGIFSSLGYKLTIPEEAEEAIILSCGFIKDAKKETIENLNYLLELKKKKFLKKIYFSGCMAKAYGEELKQKFKEIDEIIEPEKIEDFFKIKGRRIVSTKGYAYLKIAEGCNHKCSFCIIPYLTGNYRSKKIEEIIGEAKELEEFNVKELILIAQDLLDYGADLYGERKILKLLEEILKETSFPWIRLLYLYPENFPLELIEFIRRNKRVLPYFDLPFQHVSKKILKKMERGGSYESFLKLVKKIRGCLKESTIRSTFIIGFPEEGEEDIKELEEFLREAKLDRVGFFIYSDEKESKAYKLKEKVPKKMAKRNLSFLANIQKEISFKNHLRFLNGVEEFLLEERFKNFGVGRLKSQAPEIDGYLKIKNLPENFKERNLGFVEIRKVSAYNFFGKYYEDYKHI